MKLAWLSFHIFVGEAGNDFLLGCLQPYLAQSKADAVRWFFIRHSEGGMHVRLRLLPRNQPAAVRLTERLRAAVQSSGYQMEEVVYSRSLYFGDNPESTYSELLNQQTSSLALRILTELEGSNQRLTKITAVLWTLYQVSSPDHNHLIGEINKSLTLLSNAACRAGLAPPATSSVAERLLIRLDEQVPQLSLGLKSDHCVQTIAHLSRRVRKLSRGDEVWIHAIHLFCNKLGFALLDEYRLLVLLKAFALRQVQ